VSGTTDRSTTGTSTKVRGVSDAAVDKALRLLQESDGVDADGYVHLQTVPYRSHHLLASCVLDVTEPGDRVLECGVSSGYFASLLVRAGLRVDGHELDPEAGERARKVCERVYVGDLNTFDPVELDGSYDVLLFGDTLEHLPDPAAVLRRLRTHLDDSGALILSIPNVANWAIRLGLLAGRFDYTDRGIMDRTHLRFYTQRTLTLMLEDAGFRIERMIVTAPVPFVKSEKVGRLATRVANLRPTLFGHGFLVTARPTS
jgi:2-polyprenyl-3-methyl-5-hydroxy-6-metoxy-1,4-benzoquinol methylase